MIIINKKLFFLIFILLFISCGVKFNIYDIDDKKSEFDYSQAKKHYYDSNGIDIYFDRSEIIKKYTEVKIIETNNYYYGEFFFDKLFMKQLLNNAASISNKNCKNCRVCDCIVIDGLIYEEEFSSFPDYKEDFIYFTGIKYED